MRIYKHLTFTDRLRIERALKEGLKVADISRLLGKHRNTIYRELKRGMCQLRDSNTWNMKEVYCADVAERKYQEHLRQKGPDLKIGSNIELANYLEKLMMGEGVSKRYSPGAAIAMAHKNGMDIPFSEVTLYSYISKGVFLRLTNNHLIDKGKKKQRYRKIRIKKAPPGESIERRPESINQNVEYGHWEMDSVVGKRKRGKCLLTLTERKSNSELAFLVSDHTASSVVSVLDTLEMKLGSAAFRKTFRSFTVDNGVEFSDCAGMEKSCIDNNPRTKVYWCHPYSSHERGKNENQNRMLRRFFPKGMDLNSITQAEVDEAVNWLNAYPRQLLGWKSPADLFQVDLPV